MSTLEDRILGEKVHYYCSSSESEDEDSKGGEHSDDENNEGATESSLNPSMYSDIKQPNIDSWEGSSVNTGPKGVLRDWQRFKQLETERRKEQEQERIALAKKLTMTCRSHLDDEREKEKQGGNDDDSFAEEAFLQQYIHNRMEELMKNTSKKKMFGHLLHLQSGEDFLDAVDKEEKDVVVIIHLFDQKIQGCEAVNGCLLTVAHEYPEVKFCYIQASAARLSKRFQGAGLPALVIYKGGQMIGNFVRLLDDLGEDFFAADLENFLIEHGFLQDKSVTASVIRARNGGCDSDNDSD